MTVNQCVAVEHLHLPPELSMAQYLGAQTVAVLFQRPDVFSRRNRLRYDLEIKRRHHAGVSGTRNALSLGRSAQPYSFYAMAGLPGVEGLPDLMPDAWTAAAGLRIQRAFAARTPTIGTVSRARVREYS